MINWRSMNRGYNGEEGQPRSQYDYFVKFWNGRGIYNIVRVPEDKTVGEYVNELEEKVKGFVLHHITSEWKSLATALGKAWNGATRREQSGSGSSDFDIAQGRNRI